MADAAGDALLVLGKAEGRRYDCGRMQALFKVDEGECDARYAVSEWWLEPGCDGPGAHSHEANEELFYVLEGTVSFLAGEEWIDAGAGAFLRIPARMTHDFCNRSDRRAGVLNVFIPGGFERNMPAIADWFARHPSAGEPGGGPV